MKVNSDKENVIMWQFTLLSGKNVGYCFHIEKIHDKVSRNLESKDMGD